MPLHCCPYCDVIRPDYLPRQYWGRARHSPHPGAHRPGPAGVICDLSPDTSHQRPGPSPGTPGSLLQQNLDMSTMKCASLSIHILLGIQYWLRNMEMKAINKSFVQSWGYVTCNLETLKELYTETECYSKCSLNKNVKLQYQVKFESWDNYCLILFKWI